MMVVLKSDYSHCPLKKRPLSVCYDDAGDEQTEPEDLSLKCGREASSSLLSTRTYFTCTQESFVHERRTPVIRTREPRLQTACSQGPHSDTLDAHAPDKLEDCPETDALGVCARERHKHAQNACAQDPHGEDRLQEQEAEPSAPEPRLSSCSATTATQHLDGGYSASGCGGCSCPPRTTAECLSSRGSADATPSAAASSPSPSAARDGAAAAGPPSSGPSEASPSGPSEATPPGAADGRSPAAASAARPHRPWLADDPPRQLLRRFQNVSVALRPARPFLASSRGLWAGVVPLSWPVPHLLAPSQPPSPGRHYRECGSPGSESASSDGGGSSSSSGGGRGEARYSCSDCSKSYSTYSGLSKHKQFHCLALGAKSFGCKHCDKVYTSLGALKMHIRTHTLPCKCQLCGKAFSRPWLLQGHIRTHTGEKPFQCPQCDRCFADRSNLRAHLQTHADVKKYACTTCHKTFSRMSLLNKHTEAACPARPQQEEDLPPTPPQ